MRDSAFRGYGKSLDVKILNSRDPIEQLRLTKIGLKVRVEEELRNSRGFKFKETLVVTLKKPMVCMFSDSPPKDGEQEDFG